MALGDFVTALRKIGNFLVSVFPFLAGFGRSLGRAGVLAVTNPVVAPFLRRLTSSPRVRAVFGVLQFFWWRDYSRERPDVARLPADSVRILRPVTVLAGSAASNRVAFLLVATAGRTIWPGGEAWLRSTGLVGTIGAGLTLAFLLTLRHLRGRLSHDPTEVSRRGLGATDTAFASVAVAGLLAVVALGQVKEGRMVEREFAGLGRYLAVAGTVAVVPLRAGRYVLLAATGPVRFHARVHWDVNRIACGLR